MRTQQNQETFTMAGSGEISRKLERLWNGLSDIAM